MWGALNGATARHRNGAYPIRWMTEYLTSRWNLFFSYNTLLAFSRTPQRTGTANAMVMAAPSNGVRKDSPDHVGQLFNP